MLESRKVVSAVVWASVAICASVWVLRITSAVSFDRPFLGGTSGCEEEALFSIWKAANGLAVYNSPWLPPFSASYFGWLFYETYGLWVKTCLALSGLDDAWLPTFSRIFTLAGLMACIGVFYRLLQSDGGWSGALPRSLLFGFAALVFINPLFHWWSFTTRADVWALAFELAALLAAFRYVNYGSVRSVIIVGLLVYLAWSFRQTNISVLCGFGLWLLFAGRWKTLFLLGLAMAIAFAATMALLGRDFIDSAFTANAMSGEILMSVAKSNAFSALTKDPLFAAALLVVVAAAVVCRSWWHIPSVRVVFLAAVVSLVLGGLFSAKVGASSNYYLPPAALAPLFAAKWLTSAGQPVWRFSLYALVATAGTGLASALVLLGVSGNLRVPGDQRMQELRAMRSSLTGPVFCTDRGGNLPWVMGTGADSYVFGYAYHRMLEARPENFTRGTIADRLRNGDFATLVLASVNASYVPSADEIEAFRAAGGRVVEF